MRIITEENVDQLLNLSYQSKNISKLLNISDTDFKDINALTTQYRKQLDIKLKKSTYDNNKPQNQRNILDNFLRVVEPQQFDNIDITQVEKMPDISMKQDWSPVNEATDVDVAAWDNRGPQTDWNSPTQPPGYADPNLAMAMPMPEFSDPTLKSWWPVLVISEQQHILSFPKNKQEDEMKIAVKNRMRYLQTGMPNYGPDGELNMLFAKLSAPEQIQLLRLSYENQINKLKKMARDNLEPNNFNNLRIIVPDNKTSSEELYGSPELQMLAPAPANTPVTEDKPADDKKDVSGGSTNNSNIKKIIF
jgi:hypothetical protein